MIDKLMVDGVCPARYDCKHLESKDCKLYIQNWVKCKYFKEIRDK